MPRMLQDAIEIKNIQISTRKIISPYHQFGMKYFNFRYSLIFDKIHNVKIKLK